MVSHTSEIFTKKIYRKIEKQVERELCEDQFCYRRDVRSHEALLTGRLIFKDKIKKNRPIFGIFRT